MSTGNKVIVDLFSSLGQGANEDTIEFYYEAVSNPKALDALDALRPNFKATFIEAFAKASHGERLTLLPPGSPLTEDKTFADVVFEAIRDSNGSVDPNGLETLFAKADSELQAWAIASMSLDGLGLLEHSKPPPEAFERLLDVLLGHNKVGTWDYRLAYNSPQDTCAIVLIAYARCLDQNQTIPERFTPLLQRAMKSTKHQIRNQMVEVLERLPSEARAELDQAES